MYTVYNIYNCNINLFVVEGSFTPAAALITQPLVCDAGNSAWCFKLFTFSFLLELY